MYSSLTLPLRWLHISPCRLTSAVQYEVSNGPPASLQPLTLLLCVLAAHTGLLLACPRQNLSHYCMVSTPATSTRLSRFIQVYSPQITSSSPQGMRVLRQCTISERNWCSLLSNVKTFSPKERNGKGRYNADNARCLQLGYESLRLLIAYQ
jgi:hypothetical protein